LNVSIHHYFYDMNALQTTGRVISVDIFRGLTILVMVFVNDLASVEGLPWWTYHIPPGENGMTYVDVVFPAFLFIVGMAIPLAIDKRRSRGDTTWQLIYHTFVRALSLVAIGLLIMNGRNVDPALTGISYANWNTLMFIGVILLWNVYPKAQGKKKMVFIALKWLGLLIMVFLVAIYKRELEGETAWMNLKTWSILGLIGWAYLSVVLIYLLVRGSFILLAGSFILLVILNIASKAGYANFLQGIPDILWPVGDGALASITMAGVLLSRIYLKNDVAPSQSSKYIWSIIMASIIVIGGWWLMPFGLAKIGATPSWCLFSSAICILLFILLYWIVDIKKQKSWATFMKPAGSNPLLTYILPDIFYAIFGLHYFSEFAGESWPGVARALLFSLFILGVSALMTRFRIRLQL
jgi:heparan-alpha-glucosaminide N-acetyltransferase